MPDYFLAHPAHMGPIHSWLNHTVGASQGAGTAIIAVIFALFVIGLATAALKKLFA